MNTASDRFGRVSNILFIIWLILLLPCWLLFFPSAMVFDGGYTWQAYTFVWSIWTYPVALGVAGLLRKKAPLLVFLPAVNVAALLVSGL